MTLALVAKDLLFGSRVAGLAEQAGRGFLRVDHPRLLPSASEVAVVLVDWSERLPDWTEALRAWGTAQDGEPEPRVILFGPHIDRSAHEAARASGYGPMWARSRVLNDLPKVLRAAGDSR